MSDTKLEISGRITDDPPPASFKTISESDTEETALQEAKATKSMSKVPNSNVEVDGADEKMLLNEEKPLTEDSKIDIADAKYSLNADKQNGEAKLDIADLKQVFVGMGKEELMKYANDPFWVKLRWILFVTFWLIWLAMLVGAILIIIAAPKCAPPTPRTWWERGPLTEVSYPVEIGTLEKLKENRIQGFIIKSPVEDSFRTLNDPDEEKETLELNQNFKTFMENAREKDLNIILELKPTNSDKFFVKSETRDPGYEDYYIWADAKGKNENGEPIAPNNWLSPSKDRKAWHFSERRNQFYYSPKRLPHLNYRNPKVIDEFTSVLQYWLSEGVRGFQLADVPHLLVDENLRNWTLGSGPGHIHDEYEFYDHSRTVNVEGIGEILREWRKVVKNNTEESIPFMLAEDLNSLDSYLVNGSLSIDLPRHSNVFTTKDRVSTASLIYNGVNSAFTILGDNWPIWRFVETSLSSDVMNILTMLLPGSIQLDPNVEVALDLLVMRDVPSIMFGSCHRHLLANNTIFAYQRVQAGNPGYIVACNPSDNLVMVDFSSMRNVSEEVTIQVLSINYTIPNIDTGLKVPANAFQMPAQSAAVLTYVPK